MRRSAPPPVQTAGFFNARAQTRMAWVLATHRIPAPIRDALTDAADALRWEAARAELSDRALAAAYAEIARLKGRP